MVNKIFLDTNILLDILSNERVSSLNTKELLTKYINENIRFVVNNLSLNNLYYVASKIDKNKTFSFMKEISFNNPLWEIYYLNSKDLKEVYNFMDKNIDTDFEDLQQYISAKNSSCKTIITNDKNFPKLDIELIRTNPTIENYTPKN